MLTTVCNISSDLHCSDLRAVISAAGCARIYVQDEDAFLELGKKLGRIVASPRDGKLVEVLTVTEIVNSNKNSMSARFGAGQFPFHTDQAYKRLPPRFILLWHRLPLTSRETCVSTFSPYSLKKVERDFLARGIWKVHTGSSIFFSPVLDQISSDHFVFRYDPCIMKPLCHIAKQSERILNKHIEEASTIRHRYKESECLVIDNWKFLHGRASGSGDQGTRQLLRISVE